MSERALKVLPILLGVVLGVLLVAAPERLKDLGPLRFVLVGALVLGLLLVFVTFSISANLPADIALEPLPGATLGDLGQIVADYRALGFTPAGSPLRAGVAPPALLVPLVHTDGKSYATVFRTGTVPAKTSFDVVSILEGGLGGLTTTPTPSGATLPATPGQLRQVIPGARVDALVEQHRTALTYLERRGLHVQAVSAATFAADFKAAVASQRRHFLSSPLTHALVALWRSVTRLTPHTGPIQSQRIAQRQIAQLLTGRRG